MPRNDELMRNQRMRDALARGLIFRSCKKLRIWERSNLRLRNLRSPVLISLLLVVAFPIVPHAVGARDSGPTVEITVGALADNYADSMYPKSAYGSRPILYVGNSYDRAQNLSGPARIYIQFDLSAVPDRALVVSAEILLYQMYALASPQTYEAHIVQSQWNESTMNWTTQPSTDAAVISTAKAPAVKDVWVLWNVTSAVQRWVNRDTPNYGFMIRIQNEKTGVANEASGFYSREYPNGELKPKLRVFCQNNPPFTYLSTVHMSGLPAELSSMMTADDAVRIQVSGEEAAYFLFKSRTEHMITADEYVNAGESVRYHARDHSIDIVSDAEVTITYEPQFLIIVKSEPAGLIQREWSNWYDRGTEVETPPARAVAYDGSDMRILLDAWYLNDDRKSGNAIRFTVDEPATVVAKYATTYIVNASSPFGNVSGSGWHTAASSVEISVTPTYVADEGVLGYLGFGMTFDHWSGSFDSPSPKTTTTVNGPIEVRAAWREDRSRFLLGVAISVGLVLVVGTLRMRGKHRRPEDRLRKTGTRNSSRLL